MKSISTILILACISLLLPSCKYEDGPSISLRSKKSRLLGRKKITQYLVNGIDSLPYVEAAFDTTSYSSTGFEWYEDYDVQAISTQSNTIPGYWNFQENGSKMRITFPTPLFSGEIIPMGTWTILRLSLDDFWISMSKNNKSYYIEFVRLK